MQERTVTIDRDTHELSPNFTVFATQNPIEYEGTYPLPEAQKDRFMLKVPVGYPDRDQELELAKIRLRNEDEASKRQTDAKRDYELARMASEREIEFKRIDTNLITSHARVASE